MNPIAVNVEDKLFQNRYRVDAGRPHIRIKDAQVCTDGCRECGSCRILCSEHGNIEWEYPRGGHGILFKFG